MSRERFNGIADRHPPIGIGATFDFFTDSTGHTSYFVGQQVDFPIRRESNVERAARLATTLNNSIKDQLIPQNKSSLDELIQSGQSFFSRMPEKDRTKIVGLVEQYVDGRPNTSAKP